MPFAPGGRALGKDRIPSFRKRLCFFFHLLFQALALLPAEADRLRAKIYAVVEKLIDDFPVPLCLTLAATFQPLMAV
ncbi:hypothetical protein GGP56_003147 [Salinibacter ruber]|uniref:Uncharacterized protein n=1 Tax=Salinibacter ruber TaxID=146919 RepID=A0A9X2UPI7_9BACT|nr:hypothetical protein [Salinibacter ruber]MCS3616679.1 hypothetical protein [Salinibacter ruber]MCS4037789.1 hypothetical protein [Salinibacter ruber]MCS4198263.1 hypothetical protein [Salinibacter ruber]